MKNVERFLPIKKEKRQENRWFNWLIVTFVMGQKTLISLKETLYIKVLTPYYLVN
ncbi:hypothetical protein BACI349Y_210058 [Bacillus sp. 349Y]|nr:hypothetical protein BACI349Y_210058 [Bacillus sp. 349Y]